MKKKVTEAAMKTKKLESLTEELKRMNMDKVTWHKGVERLRLYNFIAL